MQFSYFHLMPYTATRTVPHDWPVSNKDFDPKVGANLYRGYLDNLTLAEECGFDWIGCNEHHMSPYGLMSNPNIIGAALIERTKRAKIAIVGSLVPLLNPIRIAEEYAMLDVMSGGRLIAGLLRGIPHEYVAYNVPPDESYGRLIEAIHLIKKAWTAQEPFGWEGKYYQFRAISIWPKPYQQPHPRILMSGSTESSAKLAAREGAMLGLVQITDVEATKKMIRVYRDEAKECGWNPGPEDILIGCSCLIADSFKEAKETLEEGRNFLADILGGGMRTAQQLVLQKSRYYDDDSKKKFMDMRKIMRVPIEDLLAKKAIMCGTAEMVTESIHHLHKEFGHGCMSLSMKIGNVPDEVTAKSLRLFRDKVRPHVHNL
ncbi:MAG: LLM class flavin-dependent oxidoreductase [Alphaproteobacteria bacterium]|nr:LLM class flavin-dependent oxidoreductase [Alphaproteobacteria bacterium]